MKKIALIAALTAVSVGMAVSMADARDGHHARGGMEREMPTFAELDANSDGQITIEDIAARQAARFGEVDTNGDGTVSKEEFIAHAQAQSAERAGEMFDRLDVDGDGTLSADVLSGGRGGPQMAERMIDRADTDNDGGVSEEEFAQALERMQDRRGGGHGGRGHDRGDR